MSQIEPMVRELQAMTTLTELPGFFLQIQQQYQYPFCGLVLWRAQRKAELICAGTKEDFNFLTSHNQLQVFCQQRCTPALASDSGLIEALPFADEALLIPIRGVGTDAGVLIIGMQSAQVELAEHIAWYWTIIANYVYEAIYRLAEQAADNDNFGLTSREKSCLSWAAKGKTSWEISQILSISERTVNFHLGNCIAKTNSNNRQQAICRCISAGHIYI
ncbi:helix-turn-helix transcriptional regulator [Rheinheimera oceanensis]|uniref:helix-turn-helix transcriptional regulator n=1 Tax=Rheinheimera oceanensis TaxID=2817449 RepID=UPI001BFDAC84|nr:LuxR C-terminal-related transcriptional regulator [Rheinheimera oceanensis]